MTFRLFFGIPKTAVLQIHCYEEPVMSEKYQARDAAFSIVYKDPQEILKEARAQLVLILKRSWTKARLFFLAWGFRVDLYCSGGYLELVTDTG